MCHLVTDTSESVPQMAYKLLREAAHKRTEYLVVEASVDSDDTIPLDLPTELVQLLQNSFVDEDIDDSVHNHNVFGYLLTWMLAFDLFTDAVCCQVCHILTKAEWSVLVVESQVWLYGSSTARRFDWRTVSSTNIHHPSNVWRLFQSG